MPTIDFFRGKRVVDFDPSQSLQDNVVYRVYVEAYTDNGQVPVSEQIEALSNKDGVQYLTSLIIGNWGMDEPPDASSILPSMLEAAPKFESLTGLVWGDIDSEEFQSRLADIEGGLDG